MNEKDQNNFEASKPNSNTVAIEIEEHIELPFPNLNKAAIISYLLS